MSNPLTILICDDVEDNRLILKAICNRIPGVTTIEAEDGLEALVEIERYRPQIVLMDLMMPRMDGFETTKLIKERYPDTIIMVVTALVDEENESLMMRMGAFAYIRKPIDRDVVRLKISHAMQRVHMHKGSAPLLSTRHPLSPLATDVRPHKTLFMIEQEEDIMNLGLWLSDFFCGGDLTADVHFDTLMEFIYKTLTYILKEKHTLTVFIEENFETLFITYHPAIEYPESIVSRYTKELTSYLRIQHGMIAIAFPLSVATPHLLSKPLIAKEEKTSLEKEKREITDKEKQMLRFNHSLDVISAHQFSMSISDYLHDEIEDLKEYERLWDEYMSVFKDSYSLVALEEMADNAITKYAHILNHTYEFSSLGYVLSTLAALFKNVATTEPLPNESMEKFVKMIEFLLHDLKEWRRNIFDIKMAENIHYLDASLLSSCMQIESMITQKVVETGEDDDLELF